METVGTIFQPDVIVTTPPLTHTHTHTQLVPEEYNYTDTAHLAIPTDFKVQYIPTKPYLF